MYQGALLPDPAGLMEGTGAKMRHVKMRSAEDAERASVHRLLETALAERRQALGMVPRGGVEPPTP